MRVGSLFLGRKLHAGYVICCAFRGTAVRAYTTVNYIKSRGRARASRRVRRFIRINSRRYRTRRRKRSNIVIYRRGGVRDTSFGLIKPLNGPCLQSYIIITAARAADVKSGAEYGGQVCGLGFAETRSGRVTRTVVTSGREGPVFGSRVNTWGFEDDRRSREFRLNGDGVAAGRGAEGNLRP